MSRTKHVYHQLHWLLAVLYEEMGDNIDIAEKGARHVGTGIFVGRPGGKAPLLRTLLLL